MLYRREAEIRAFASNLHTIQELLHMDDLLLAVGKETEIEDWEGNEIPAREYSIGIISEDPMRFYRRVLRTYVNASEKNLKEKEWYAAQFTEPEQLDYSKPHWPSLQFASRQWDSGKEPRNLCHLYGRERVRALENLVMAGMELFKMENAVLGLKGEYTMVDQRKEPTEGYGIWVFGYGDMGDVMENTRGMLYQSLEKEEKKAPVYLCYRIIPDIARQNYASIQLSYDNEWRIVDD